MQLEDNPITEEAFNQTRDDFLSDCEKGAAAPLVHKKCGGAIRGGFMNCFWVTPEGELDPGRDGFGIGPVSVPYCENCDPPDGFNHTYAIRVGLIPKDESTVSPA